MSNQIPPPPEPQNQYGASAYGGYQPVPEHPQATLVLVLGILGVLTGVVAPVAWYLGGKAKKEIEASGGRLGGLQQVTAGWILGIVMTIVLVLTLVAAVILVILAIGLFASAT